MRLKQKPVYVALSLLLLSISSFAEQKVQQAIELQEGINASASSSQAHINKLSNETQHMLEDYRQTLRKAEDLKAYNEHLRKLIESQKNEMSVIASKLKEIDSTQQNISPLMLQMVSAMAEFISLDMPFLKGEREQRVKQLQEIMHRADISVSEKFRRVMEAYQIEMNYGKTIEAYQGNLTNNDSSRTVDYLRIGRIGFYYRTLDGNEMGYWDKDKKSWAELDSKFDSDIVKAFRIARKQQAPDLLIVPVQKTGGVK